MKLTLPYGTFEGVESDSLNTQTLAEGFWDSELRPYLDLVKPGEHVVDAGAHIGLYTVYWAKKGINVTAFEAHPVYYPLLATNIHNNQVRRRVNHWRTFLYSRPTCLREVKEHETAASNTWMPSDWMEPQSRYAMRLDQVRNLPTVHLLKVDAQGADLHVVLGAEEIIARDRPRILIEFEERLAALHGHGAEDYHRWAAEHGYREVPINGWNCLWEPR